MKTKLDYYRIFYETARHASFSSAAEHIYISQSAISQCIHQLERDLSVQLFVRTRKGVTLTKEGTLLFKKIESAISLIEQGESLLERLHHLESGSLIIAAGDTIAGKYLLPYIEKFHQLYPGICIEMANSYSYHMLELVKDGKADLAFINMPVEDDELIIKPCLEIHDIFVCGTDFKAKKSYTWEEIANEPLVLLERNSSSRKNLDFLFQQKQIPLNPQIEVAAHELLIKLASIHLGVSCVVEEFAKDSLKSGVIKKINISPSIPARSVGCAYVKNQPLSVAAREFLKLIGIE